MAALTAALTGGSSYQALVRYEQFRSGWAWDLAYYNQWFWALTYGDGVDNGPPASQVLPEGGAVDLEDELPGPDSLCNRPDLSPAPRPENTTLDPEHCVLVGRSRGLHASTRRVGVAGPGGLCGGTRSTLSDLVAARLE